MITEGSLHVKIGGLTAGRERGLTFSELYGIIIATSLG